MRMNVVNHHLSVGSMTLTGVASSSVLQIGDTGKMSLYSYFDTPPESLVVGPIAPLPEPRDTDGSASTADASGGITR